ncbi:MAG: alpha/beta hydrolase [Parcubacteria group bacterium]
MKEEHIIVDDLDVSYLDRGEGEIFLFLHGWGMNAFSFNDLMERFGDKRCVALSLPGFGGSEKPKTAWSVADYAKFVRKFLERLEINGIKAIIAHSFGGRVAIKGVASGILDPKKLILIASAGAAKKSLKMRILGMIAKIAKIFFAIWPLSLLKNRLKQVVGSRDYLSAGEMRGTFIKAINESLLPDAKKISIPTLLMWGDRDTETPLNEAYRFTSVIKNAKLEIFSGAGHFVFKERLNEVAEAINKFL